MEPSPFPDIKYNCPDDCPPEVHEAIQLLFTAAINNKGVALEQILKKAGITDKTWWSRVRGQVQAHFPNYEIVSIETGLSGPRPLTLIPKNNVQ
ncbi:hypothetical protein A2634_05220 [Candidatus Amesbacteria bacterium RIFCSPHIGHO2_01_FULL_48_32]|uniref:Uncharacterized protein n=1 Tax=Candidatus Amesbacteria bacterium RIFCSPLOWO2_01_FULL_48_25 TaxID=1797259 RepID=A0A1F4ZCI5_9BACT|nr:MAG: hypothetical protein A2634_05220 [Candidatus Amesbacteria bacterium RIFCSPHIGHO2_01_FULL_48_32]OGD04069.1 MAG: hypothetical protein A2989_01565 [Candidatus Amesbacteria bacterium RIFCSPLOWO2_01_FULL_48_25]HJZ05667.1 hypothetical protein [Patescibacteria group bacterium]